ncbi:protein ALP1-like [Stegodyphus dumicola]|uniref:protein ALP1-like n=1 Tax=Stegodyphus dumicola TaxID=202533 RepID=UPI0015AD49FE|nr:protein ALP1-like [Stegodyphus dumicola]
MRCAISPSERLHVTLRFLAGGCSYSNLQYLFRIPKQTLSRVIPEVLDALWECMQDYIKTPNTAQEWKAIEEAFAEKWNLPHCVGAIDGKHVMIKAPAGGGSTFYNYKSFNSIVLMASVDADYKFTFIDVGCNGRISDGGVFAQTSLFSMLDNNLLDLPSPTPLIPGSEPVNYFMVADEAFPLKCYLMRPYPGKNISPQQRIFNYRLSRARRVVENAFGILSNRFRILMQPIQLPPATVDKIVSVCCCLHNFLRERPSRQLYTPRELIDHEDEDFNFIPGSWRNEESLSKMKSLCKQNGYNTGSAEARLMREKICDYVNNEGKVAWQDKFIKYY